MGFFGNLIEGVGLAKHKAAVDAFLKRVVGLDLPTAQLDDFAPLIAAGYRAESSIEDIGLRIATAFYAKACMGTARDRAVADRLYLKLNFVIRTSAALGAIAIADAEEFETVVRDYTQQRLLRDD